MKKTRKAFPLVGAALISLVCTGSYGDYKYEGPWPPYSYDQCISAAATGELTKRDLSLGECYEITKADGKAAAIKNAQDYGFYILEFGLWEVNTAGGVVPYLWAVNANSGSPIKYLTVDLTVYNKVGDRVRSTIGGASTARIRVTGPLGSADGPKKSLWEPVAYNHSAACLQAESVRVEFMDGKVKSFSGAALKTAFHPAAKYRCK